MRSSLKNGNFVVSANYLDRGASKRWLARKGDEPETTAQAFKSIMATGVRFGPSSEYERGFGCATVAHCETVVTSNRRNGTPEGIRLRFSPMTGCFYDPAGEPVLECERLVLCADGSMHAVLKTSSDAIEAQAEPTFEPA